LDVYPGSPLIAAQVLRPNDRLLLCELQDDEVAELRRQFGDDPRVAVHQRDGYAALKALLPPKERRGLVLIDPPFELQEQEFSAIQTALAPAFERFPTGVYAVWYPIKIRAHVAPFHRWLRHSGMKKILVAELLLHPDDSILRLNGCGMAIVNTPWQVDVKLKELLPLLLRHLAQGRFGAEHIEWLVC
jgi:23S rRNA (adenine2030-N6)-methyltransferase